MTLADRVNKAFYIRGSYTSAPLVANIEDLTLVLMLY